MSEKTILIFQYIIPQTRRSNHSSSSPVNSSSSLRRKMSGGSITENNGYNKKSESSKVSRQRNSATPSSTNTGDGKFDFKFKRPTQFYEEAIMHSTQIRIRQTCLTLICVKS